MSPQWDNNAYNKVKNKCLGADKYQVVKKELAIKLIKNEKKMWKYINRELFPISRSSIYYP